MTVGKQCLPRHRPAWRLFWAGCCICAWLVASSYCSLECVFGCADDGAPAASAAAPHVATAPAHRGTAGHARGHDDDHDFCCTSLHVLVPDTAAAAPAGPRLVPIATVEFLPWNRTLTFDPPEITPPRRPPVRAAVLSPVVFLGPALRSLAPPAAVIG